MDNLEKVERLRERADVTYEEAKEALDEAGGDILDAIVILERHGKVKAPKQSTYSTSYEEQAEYVRVKDKVQEQERSAVSFGEIAGKVLRTVWNIVRNNSLCISRNGELLFMLPAWIFALIVFFTWRGLIPCMVIALFFGIRYSFSGRDDLSKANDFMAKAESIVEGVKKEFRKKDPE